MADKPPTLDEIAAKGEKPPKAFGAKPAGDLRTEFPDYRAPVVDGLLRRGEVANLIAAPKTGKSWLVLDLALSAANGSEWLGRTCSRVPVLLIDAELHQETLSRRIDAVATALALPDDGLIVCPRRGRNNALDNVSGEIVKAVTDCGAGLIIVDALYRFWPPGTSENDNAGVTSVYNLLDGIADESGAAVVVVHHSSKGNQAEKSVTDGGSGAGAISRAADTHIFLRQHQDEGRVVVDCVTRSFPQPESFVINRDGNLWTIDTEADPSRLAGKSASGASDRLDDDTLLTFMRANHEPREVIAARIDAAGLRFGGAKLKGRLELLVADGKVHRSRGPRGAGLYGTEPAPDTNVSTRIAEAVRRNPEASNAAIAAEVGCTERAVRKWRADNE